MFDLIIIGAGPAGLTSGIYALRAGKTVKIFERETIGGHITSSPMVSNYPGLINVSGMEIADNLYNQLESLGGQIDFEEVIEIQNGTIKKVITEDGTYECKSIIIATGTKYRMLELENEEKYIGNGISFCVTCDGAFYKDKIVAVVGGSNSAIVEALELSRICKEVIMIVRSSLKGDEIDIKKVLNTDNIKVLYKAKVTKLIGNTDLEAIEVTTENNVETIKIDGMFLAIGQIPNINIIDKITKDSEGYINAYEDCSTNIEGIFVAGDVKSKKIRQLTTATSDGTIAALSAIDYLNKLK